jgi:hypothetical protein
MPTLLSSGVTPGSHERTGLPVFSRFGSLTSRQ